MLCYDRDTKRKEVYIMYEKIVKLIGSHYYEACDTGDIETCKHNIDMANYLMAAFGEDLDIADILMLQDAHETALHYYTNLIKFESED